MSTDRKDIGLTPPPIYDRLPGTVDINKIRAILAKLDQRLAAVVIKRV